MTWGAESHVEERFGKAGIAREDISLVRDTYVFEFAGTPATFVGEFRDYYPLTMNAFDAAEKNGRADQLANELEDLFQSQNKSPSKGATSIPATFLRVTIER